MRTAILLLAAAFLLSIPALAQAPEGTPKASMAASAGGASAPVPVPQPSEKALSYYRSGNVLWFVNTAWSLAALALLLWTGFSARLRDLARRIGRNRFFTIAVYGVLFSLVTFVLDLPLSWYEGFVREHAYGLSNQTAAKWWSDQLISLLLSPVLLAVSRHNEHEADRFGLEITRDNHDCATAFVKLQRENLSVPRPGLLYKLWRSSHPPLGERIDFCNEYRPWEKGEPLRYGKFISPPAEEPRR